MMTESRTSEPAYLPIVTLKPEIKTLLKAQCTAKLQQNVLENVKYFRTEI